MSRQRRASHARDSSSQGVTGTQQLPRKRAGVLPVSQEHGPGHDRRDDPGRLLLEPRRPTGKVRLDRREDWCDGVGIEDVDVGGVSLIEKSSVSASHTRAGTAVIISTAARATSLSVANPIREEVRLDRRVHDLVDVRASVRERHDGGRMLHPIEQGVLVQIVERLHEELVAFALEDQVNDELGRTNPTLGRQGR